MTNHETTLFQLAFPNMPCYIQNRVSFWALIRTLNLEAGKKFMKYVPFWACMAI